MKKIAIMLGAALLLTAGIMPGSTPGGVGPLLGASAAGAADDPTRNPCAPPSQVSANINETAWELWVAATCPVNSAKYPFVVWENWIEQAQMYPLDPAKGLFVPNAEAKKTTATHLLHGSPFAVARNPSLTKVVPGLLGAADQNCNKAGRPPKSQPDLVICEEVRLNGATEDYIAANGFWNRGGQALAAVSGDDIQFPAPAVEIKADWIQTSTIPGLSSNCSKLPAGFATSIHVEMVNGNCFALAGMHLISKLRTQWIWATFEPQFSKTNPSRCRVLGCIDTFGSSPAMTDGPNTQQTARLKNLMVAANLAPEWFNYRLDAVQTGFYSPGLLGNSIIEGENVGMSLSQASCISCHAVSSIRTDGADGITLLTSNPVGAPKPLPSKAWIRRDFVWSMFEACPGSVAQDCAP